MGDALIKNQKEKDRYQAAGIDWNQGRGSTTLSQAQGNMFDRSSTFWSPSGEAQLKMQTVQKAEAQKSRMQAEQNAADKAVEKQKQLRRRRSMLGGLTLGTSSTLG